MKKSSFLIVGKHAVTEALKNQDRNVLRVFLTEDSKKNLNRDNQDKDLLKEIKAYRNDMVARNYPFQEISDIITKWEMKLSEQSQNELEPINSPMSDE